MSAHGFVPNPSRTQPGTVLVRRLQGSISRLHIRRCFCRKQRGMASVLRPWASFFPASRSLTSSARWLLAVCCSGGRLQALQSVMVAVICTQGNKSYLCQSVDQALAIHCQTGHQPTCHTRHRHRGARIEHRPLRPGCKAAHADVVHRSVPGAAARRRFDHLSGLLLCPESVARVSCMHSPACTCSGSLRDGTKRACLISVQASLAPRSTRQLQPSRPPCSRAAATSAL